MVHLLVGLLILVLLIKFASWLIRSVFKLIWWLIKILLMPLGFFKGYKNKRYHYIYLTTIDGYWKYVGKRSTNIHPTKDKYMGSGDFVREAHKNGAHMEKKVLEIATAHNVFKRERLWIDYYKSKYLLRCVNKT